MRGGARLAATWWAFMRATGCLAQGGGVVVAGGVIGDGVVCEGFVSGGGRCRDGRRSSSTRGAGRAGSCIYLAGRVYSGESTECCVENARVIKKREYQTVGSRQVEEVISTSGRGLAMFPHEAECMIRRRGRGSAMSLCAMFKLEGERPLFRSLCHYVVRGYRAVGLYRTPLAPFRLLRLSKSARSSQQLQEKLENLVHQQ